MMRKRKSSLIQTDESVDWTGGNPDNEVFDALYLGERPVNQTSGVEVVNEVVSQLEDYELIGRKKLSQQDMNDLSSESGCVLILGPQHIIVAHKKRKEIILKNSIGSVTFFTIIPSPDSKSPYETIAYITQNVRLNVLRCHVFTVLVGLGETIARKMQVSQSAYAQFAEETIGDPFFAPKDAPREVPRGNLFNMQIHRGDLKALEAIGAGQFGAVYLATQRMRCCPYPGCDVKKAIDGHLKRHMAACPKRPQNATGDEKYEYDTVTRAVKTLKGAATPAAKQEFFKEANTMLMFDHPNVTNIMGVAVQQAPWLYVLEYCMYGDLQGVLKSCKLKKLELFDVEFCILCHGIAAGMEHISSLRLVHMDLAARNVLLAENNLVKVADFGLTRQFDKGKDYVLVQDRNIKLPIKWMSLEVLQRRKFSEQSDIWSFGITMWEILSYGAQPYKEMTNADTQKYIANDKRLARPQGCPKQLWPLLQQCWAKDPVRRGTFKGLRLSLKSALDDCQRTDVSHQPRDIGAILTDPVIEKKAREAQALRDAERRKAAAREKIRREELAAQARDQRHLWYHPNIPKKLAEKCVSQGGSGSFLIREEKKNERLLLVLNDNGTVQNFKISMEPSSNRPGKFKYIFTGRAHQTIEHIIAILRAAPFNYRGRSAKTPLYLSDPAKVPMKPGAALPMPTQLQSKSKDNPLFDG